MSDSTQPLAFVIEDNRILLRSIEHFLREELQYQVVAFGTGEEALEEIGQHPKVVFLDYYLNSVVPEAKNGMEILKEITAASPASKVIMLSHQEDGDLVHQLIQNNAYDYVIKDQDSLVRIREILQEIDEEG